MTEEFALKHLIDISHFAGERFDLVQAGGGNTSVKYENSMLIKASGYLLSEVSATKGYTTVDTNEVNKILENPVIINEQDKRKRDQQASALLKKTIISGQDRPSIETFLHALLHKYTLHVHSISVNIFTSQEGWRDLCSKISPDSLMVPYETPGIDLAVRMRSDLIEYSAVHGRKPKIVFLQNHGLIVSSDSLEEIPELTDEVVIRAEELAGVDFTKYRLTNKVSKAFNSVFDTDLMAYLVEDQQILKRINAIEVESLLPFSPDGYIFCGIKIWKSQELSKESLASFARNHKEYPKILMYKDLLFIMAQDLKKAKMIEDVLKNNLILGEHLRDKLVFLKSDELNFLGNWDAEKYRQDL